MREFAAWLQATPVSLKFQSLDWFIPLLQSIHIVTIGVVVISSLMIALRVLGRMRVDEPFTIRTFTELDQEAPDQILHPRILQRRFSSPVIGTIGRLNEIE